MIKYLHSFSPNIQISNPISPPIYNNGMQSAGMMRYNTSMNQVEVYDGTSWLVLDQSANIGLSPEADRAIEWAKKAMQEEALLKERLEKYPALKDVYEKFKMVEELVKHEENLAQSDG